MRRILCLLTTLLLLTACGQGQEKKADEAKPAAATADPGQPVSGDRMVQATIGEPSNLISFLATDASSHEVANQIFVAPLRYDRNIEVEPWAAESYEVLDGGKHLKFKLRENIRWTDGRPLTAADVEFTYRLMIDPKTPTAYGEDYKQVKEFRLTGPYTFEVFYDRVYARALISWMTDIMPKHLLEKENITETAFSRKPVGAGPYKLKEWVAGSQLTLEANPDYFEGRPYIDEIVIKIIPDTTTEFLELKAGNIDTMGLTPQQYLHQTKGPDWEKNFRKYQYLSFGYTYLGYNLDKPMFKDKRVRQALAMAINRQEIVDGVLLGMGQPAIGPYKPGTWVYNDTIKDYAYDPAAARRTLAEAGWKDTDGDGILDKDGQPFAFTVMTNQGNDLRKKTAEIIQQRLKEVGIKVELRILEWASFIKEFVNKGNFEAIILGWNITQDPDIFQVWQSSQELNHGHYKNPEVDRLLEEGRSTLDQAERKRVYDRLQEILHEDQPYCFLYYPLSLPIYSARIQGIEVAPAGIGWNSTKWWVPKNLQKYKVQP